MKLNVYKWNIYVWIKCIKYNWMYVNVNEIYIIYKIMTINKLVKNTWSFKQLILIAKYYDI